MDQDLIAYLDQRFQETTQQIQELRAETAQQFQTFREENTERFERLETEVRHVHVVVENMQGKIRLLGDGLAAVDEKGDRRHEEVLQEIRKVEALHRPAYTQLDARVRKLEGTS